jgi:hypothetical protein
MIINVFSSFITHNYPSCKQSHTLKNKHVNSIFFQTLVEAIFYLTLSSVLTNKKPSSLFTALHNNAIVL